MKTIKDVERYAKKVIPLLNLSHWEIFFKEGGDNDRGAKNSSDHVYKSSCIFIFSAFWDGSLEWKKSTVIHELIHCHTSFWNPSVKRMEDDPVISKMLCANIYNSIIDAEEECVELLARAIYKLIENDTK